MAFFNKNPACWMKHLPQPGTIELSTLSGCYERTDKLASPENTTKEKLLSPLNEDSERIQVVV